MAKKKEIFQAMAYCVGWSGLFPFERIKTGSVKGVWMHRKQYSFDGKHWLDPLLDLHMSQLLGAAKSENKKRTPRKA